MKPLRHIIYKEINEQAYEDCVPKISSILHRRVYDRCTQVRDHVAWVRTGRYVYYKMYDEYNRT
jgi:hypothetical protein